MRSCVRKETVLDKHWKNIVRKVVLSPNIYLSKSNCFKAYQGKC